MHRGSHAYLWALPDGTGLHSPYGQLVRDAETGQLCCHLCGRWFRSLAAHLRRHGYTAAEYREAMGPADRRSSTLGGKGGSGNPVGSRSRSGVK